MISITVGKTYIGLGNQTREVITVTDTTIQYKIVDKGSKPGPDSSICSVNQFKNWARNEV